MPGSALKGNILSQSTLTVDQEMCRDPEISDLPIKGMFLRGETVAEQSVDRITTKFTRWQADAMDDQQRNFPAGAIILVGARDFPRIGQPSLSYGPRLCWLPVIHNYEKPVTVSCIVKA